ncbi:MAG: hypothetical protein JXA14_03610 [Anaerolineae bacterium]|nr:hypothetical protein [Anaerolineae bacterium]
MKHRSLYCLLAVLGVLTALATACCAPEMPSAIVTGKPGLTGTPGSLIPVTTPQAVGTPAPVSTATLPLVTPVPAPGAWESFTPANHVYDVAFGPDGTLWAVGKGGVVRWDRDDGTYTRYTAADGLRDNFVSSAAVESNGTLWVGSAGCSYSRFDGERWAGYTIDPCPMEIDFLSIAVTPGTLWLGTSASPISGVYRVDETGVKMYTPLDGLAGDVVRSVAMAADGALWFGTNSGVSRFDGSDTWITFTTENGLVNNDVWSITVAPDGALWFATAGGVSRFDGATWTTYTAADGLADDLVMDVAVDPDGVVWFATWEGGVSRFDPSASSGQSGEGTPSGGAPSGAWTTYTTEDGLAHRWLTSVAVAPDGAVCFGTDGGGVSCVDDGVWTTYAATDDLADDEIWAIAVAPDGALWFGTDGYGVSRLDGEGWKTYAVEDGLAGLTVYDIAVAADGALWFATGGGGVSRFDGERWRTYTSADGLAHDIVWAIAVTPDDALWFGTEGGISRYDDEGWRTYTMEDGLGQDFVTSLAAAPDGTLWAGTWGGGVSHFDGRGAPNGAWTTYADSSGLTQVYVLAVAVDADGMVWVGARMPIEPKGSASGGIFRFDGQEWTSYSADIWAARGLNDDVVGDWVYDILVAPGGTLWFGTDGGVLQFDGETLTKYTTVAGLVSNQVRCITLAPDGVLWIGTDGGVSRYVPPE